MKLLLDRDQKESAYFSLIPLRIGSGVVFFLHVTIELEDDEQQLLYKYNFHKAALVVSDPITDLIKSFRPAAFLGIMTLIFVYYLHSLDYALPLGILVTLVMTGVYFKTLREQIMVSELLGNGRKFRCDSIIELMQKEAYLREVIAYLRLVLESAKNWHDREVVLIPPPLPQRPPQVVVMGSR